MSLTSSILKLSTLSILLMLSACGGGSSNPDSTTANNPSTNANDNPTANKNTVLPFSLGSTDITDNPAKKLNDYLIAMFGYALHPKTFISAGYERKITTDTDDIHDYDLETDTHCDTGSMDYTVNHLPTITSEEALAAEAPNYPYGYSHNGIAYFTKYKVIGHECVRKTKFIDGILEANLVHATPVRDGRGVTTYNYTNFVMGSDRYSSYLNTLNGKKPLNRRRQSL